MMRHKREYGGPQQRHWERFMPKTVDHLAVARVELFPFPQAGLL